MKKELFAELLDSVREGGAILHGKHEPARTLRIGEPDVRILRESYGLTQPKFAALMGISVATLRNWEQGRRRPEGSAQILLRVVATHPEAVLDAVASSGHEVPAHRISVPSASARGRSESPRRALGKRRRSN